MIGNRVSIFFLFMFYFLFLLEYLIGIYIFFLTLGTIPFLLVFFSSGKIAIRYIYLCSSTVAAKYAKLPILPPYLQPAGPHDFTDGCNFASGGAGILVEASPEISVST